MMNYTVYDAKGEIVSVIRASDWETLDLNTPPGCSRIEGRYPPQEYYVKDGVPKPYPEKPSDFCSFDFEAEVWVEDTDAALRQALRDLPANTTDPRDPPWPEKPK